MASALVQILHQVRQGVLRALCHMGAVLHWINPHCLHGLCYESQYLNEYLNSRNGGCDFINIEATLASLCKKQEKYGHPPDPPQASVQEQKSIT